MPLTQVRRVRNTSGRRSVRYRDANGKFWDAEIVGGGTDDVNEQQLVDTDGATAGTFTLSWTPPFGDAVTTGPIPFNATAAQVQEALEATSAVQSGELVCSGGPAQTAGVTVEFTGRYAGTNVNQMTMNTTGLTGGTSPGVTTAVAGVDSDSVRLRLTSFPGGTYVDNVPQATALSDTEAYFAFWGGGNTTLL